LLLVIQKNTVKKSTVDFINDAGLSSSFGREYDEDDELCAFSLGLES